LCWFLLCSVTEGKWDFTFDEDSRPGYLLLNISLAKHLSSTLIDVDVHPTYVSVIIKSKVLRLVLPAEVKAEESVAQRSVTTGNLVVIMPKINSLEYILAVPKYAKKGETKNSSLPTTKTKRQQPLGRVMLEEGHKHVSTTKAVRLKGIVDNEVSAENAARETLTISAVSTTRNTNTPQTSVSMGDASTEDIPEVATDSDSDDGPPPFI
jgi:hypothetical protein